MFTVLYLPYNRITHITFYTQSKSLLLTTNALLPLQYKQFRPWEVCNLD